MQQSSHIKFHGLLPIFDFDRHIRNGILLVRNYVAGGMISDAHWLLPKAKKPKAKK